MRKTKLRRARNRVHNLLRVGEVEYSAARRDTQLSETEPTGYSDQPSYARMMREIIKVNID